MLGVDEFALCSAMGACGTAKRWEPAVRLLRHLCPAFGSAFKVETVIGADAVQAVHAAAVTACAKGKAWRRSLALLDAARVVGLVPLAIARRGAAQACQWGSKWAHAVQLRGSGVASFSTLLDACGKSGQWHEATRLLSHMRAQNLRLDTSKFNAALCAYRTAELLSVAYAGRAEAPSLWEAAVQLALCTEGQSLHADAITVSTAVGCCGKASRWRTSVAVLGHSVQALSIEPTLVAVNSAITACEKDMRWEAALGLLLGARHVYTGPDVVTYNAALNACEKGWQPDMAMHVFEQLRSGRLEPDSMSYRAATGACSRGALWQQAGDMLARASRVGCANTATLNMGIGACVAAACWAAAVSLLARSRAVGAYTAGSATAPDSDTHRSALFACERANAWLQCLRFFSTEHECDFAVDSSFMACMVRTFGYGSNWIAALACLGATQMQRNSAGGACPDADALDVWNTAVWACEVAGVPPQVLPAPPPNSLPRKLLAVFEFVRRRAPPGDISTAIAAVAEFAETVQWMKVMGGSKSRILESVLQPGDRVVEFGTYIGFSSLVMLRRLRRLGGGGRVVSFEVDAGAAHVARALHAWAGASSDIEVRVGAAADWLAAGRVGLVDCLVMDHRGTRYHADLHAVEATVAPCAGRDEQFRVLADNVLLPGAPLFLARVLAPNLGREEGHRSYDVSVHDVPEFMQPELEDWIVVCSDRGGGAAGRPLLAEATHVVPRPPASRLLHQRHHDDPEWLRWSAEIDSISWESERNADTDWRCFQRRLAPAMRALLDTSRCSKRAGPSSMKR